MLQEASVRQSVGNKLRYRVLLLLHLKVNLNERNGLRQQSQQPHDNHHLNVFQHRQHHQSLVHLHHQ